MKNFVGLIVLLLLSAQVKAISLQQAIENETVFIEFRKLDEQHNYMFTGKNMVVEILNKSGTNIELEIDKGTKLSAYKNSSSNYVIVDNVSTIIEPEVMTEIGVFTFSLQKLLLQAEENDKFYFDGNVNIDVQKLCNYLFDNQFLNSLGQDAIWAINRDQPIHSIDGPNEISIPLKHFVANLLQVNYYPESRADQLIYVSNPALKKRLPFEFEIHPNDEIKIDIESANGEVIETLVKRSYQHRMNHIIYYEFPVADLTGKKIFLKSYINNKLIDNYIVVVEQENFSWMVKN